MTREELFIDLVAKQHAELMEYKQTVLTALGKIREVLKDEPENQTLTGDVGDLVVAVVTRLRTPVMAEKPDVERNGA